MKLSNASALITAAKFAKCRVRLSRKGKKALHPKRIGFGVTLSGGGKRFRLQSGKRAKNNAEPKTNRVQRHAVRRWKKISLAVGQKGKK